jgi:NitT/TauT family transport system permease protein
LIAIGVWFALWELTTAKFGWLPKPFFSPPNGLLNVYVTEAPRLLICIGTPCACGASGSCAE